MRKITIIILSLAVAMAGYAQSNSESKSLLDRAYQVYENSKGIKIDFSFSMIEDGVVQIQQSGVAMVRGNKFKIESEGVDTWFDGKTQWVLMKDFEEVNISEPSMEELASISPTALLGMYKSGYNLDKPISKTVNGKKVSEIKLTPTSSRSEFNNVVVSIDSANNTLVQVWLLLKNGVENKINIKNYNTNYNFADKDFIFNKSNYPNVEIIDLR